MVLSLLLWIYGGAQVGFYKTFYRVEKVDPIMEVPYTEEVAAFLPGIETLALGFVAFVALMAVGAVFERQQSSARP